MPLNCNAETDGCKYCLSMQRYQQLYNIPVVIVLCRMIAACAVTSMQCWPAPPVSGGDLTTVHTCTKPLQLLAGGHCWRLLQQRN